MGAPVAVAPHRPSMLVRIAKWLASFVIGAVILFVSFYFVISLCITYFKVTGRLVEGAPMYFDLRTPNWGPLLAAQALCVAILGVGFFLRSKLRGKHASPREPGRGIAAVRTALNVAVTLAIFGGIGYVAYALMVAGRS